MADVVPAGILSLPLSRLRNMLADCPAWRTWCGAANAAAALEFISIVDRENASGTFAIVDLPDEFESQMEAAGAQNLLYDRGSLMLIVQADVPAEYAGRERQDEINAALDFSNNLGAVLGELGDRAGTADFLNIDRIRLMSPGIQRVDRKFKESLGDYHNAALMVGYR